MDSSPVNEPAPPIRRLGDYELLEEIARGGMGIVYRARQVSLNRIVALKMIRDSQLATPNAVKRFRIEAEAAARLEHPNLVPLFEFGELEGFQFLSMRFIEGSNLAKELHGVPMDARPAAELIAKIARAIHYAHQRGILHRDLKPANILLDAQGQPHVTDFGLAKFTEQESGLTLSSDVLGSPNYMAPEQAAGNGQQLTTAADVYSLGAILYEILTGRPPFLAAAPLETIRKVLEEEPIPPHALYSFVDEDLETICLKCMEKEPARRYGTALELAQDLERWVADEPIHARPVSIFERVSKWMRRNPKITALLVLLHLVFVVGLAGILITSVRLASANREKDRANVRLAKNVRDFEWQKIDELIKTGKRAEALAYLSAFLREDPYDHVAATRLISMMSSCSFALPAMTPLQHGAAVNMLDLSSEGQRLLTAADDGKARIWALSAGRVLTTLVHPVKVSFASFVAGEEQVLTTCEDGSSRLWDVRQDKILFEFPKGLAAQNGIMSADRRKFALREADASMQLWDLMTQQRIGSPLQMPATVRWAAFSPDVENIALASADGTVSVWNLANAAPLASLKLPDDVTRVEFSPDSKTLAVAWGGSITFWDVSRQVKLREFKSHDGQVLQIEFSPDGKHLVSMAYDRPLVIWDVASGKSIGQPIDAERPFAYFCLSPDGKRLLTRAQSGVARAWDALTGLPLSEPFEHDGPVTFVKFSPDGRRVLTASQDGTVRVWQPQAAQRQALEIKTTDVYPAACFSQDGQQVFWTTQNRVEIYDTLSGQQVGKPMAHSAQVYRIKLSPNGKKLATAAWDNTGRVWDAQTGEPVTPPLAHRWRLFAIDFSANNRLVATGCADGTARLWNADSGQPVGPAMQHQGEVMQVQFRADARALLTASVDGTARLWSTKSGQPLWRAPIRHKGIVWSAEFSPDGQRIVTASADRIAKVWDARTGDALTQPMTHERSVYHAHFSPDGKWVVTCSEDTTARVWDSVTGNPVSQPMRHNDKLVDAQFSPNGRFILTGSQDGTARLWDAMTGYAVSEPLRHGGHVTCVQFSPDGQRCLSIANSGALRLWDVTDSPTPVPGWFCDLVEGVAGCRLNARKERQTVALGALEPLKMKSDGSQTDYYSRWAHWFLFTRLEESTEGERR